MGIAKDAYLRYLDGAVNMASNNVTDVLIQLDFMGGVKTLLLKIEKGFIGAHGTYIYTDAGHDMPKAIREVVTNGRIYDILKMRYGDREGVDVCTETGMTTVVLNRDSKLATASKVAVTRARVP